MSRKRKARDYISFAYRIESLPKPLPRVKVLSTLIRSAESGSGALPPGWEVTWMWRNKRGGPMREDSFETTVDESRASFLSLMGQRLRRDLRKVDPNARVPFYEPGDIPDDLEEELEEEREEREEARAEKEAKHKRKIRKQKKKAAKKKFKRKKKRH